MKENRRLFSKRFGQVLLNNPSIAEFEVNALDVFPDCRVLEIGGGEGALTEHLLERDVTLDCVEPDGRFAQFLSGRFHNYVEMGKLRVIKKSFTELAPGKYDRIIGNIPYHISSEIVFRISSYEFEKAILMVQKDFADRMVARTGDREYSRLSVNCAYWFHTDIIRVVDRNNFDPVPGVDSAIVQLRPLKERASIGPDELDEVLRKLFSNRRKKVGTVFKQCPEHLRDRRPEELTLDDFISVARSLNSRP